MIILGKSRGVAATIAVAIGLSVAPASAQLAPTGLAPTAPVPAQTAKPAAPAAPAAPTAQPAAKPAAPAAQPAQPGGGAAPAAKPADPKALLASGDKKLKANDYAGALADYEASNTAKASPEADLGVARSQDKLGKLPEAAAAYDKFLASSPKNKADADEAKKRSDEIKAMPGKVHVETTPAGAAIVVDGATNPSAQPLPQTTPTDIDLPAGKHTLKITAEGYDPSEKEVDVQAGGKSDLKVDLVKKAEGVVPPPPPVVAEQPAQPAPPPPPPPEPRSKVPAYVTGAVAILAAGVGTGFGIAALSASSDFDKNPTTKKADDGENNALVADMMFGIAITFGVTSAVLFLSSDAPQSAKNNTAPKSKPAVAQKKVTVTPTPYVTSTGGGAGAVIKF